MENAVCGNGVREGSEQCDDGNYNPYDACIKCQKATCGDRHVQWANDEDCEENTSLPGWDPVTVADYFGSPQWTAATCDFKRCNRLVYTACAKDVECPGGAQCLSGVCTPFTCNEDVPACTLPACPPIPGFTTFVVSGLTSYCFIACRQGTYGEPRCPVGLSCLVEPLTESEACVTAGAPAFPQAEL